jgi:hypothetical protein
VQRVPDDALAARSILENCLTDSRLYACAHCHYLFSVEPDGDVRCWVAYLTEDDG